MAINTWILEVIEVSWCYKASGHGFWWCRWNRRVLVRLLAPPWQRALVYRSWHAVDVSMTGLIWDICHFHSIEVVLQALLSSLFLFFIRQWTAQHSMFILFLFALLFISMYFPLNSSTWYMNAIYNIIMIYNYNIHEYIVCENMERWKYFNSIVCPIFGPTLFRFISVTFHTTRFIGFTSDFHFMECNWTCR